MKDIEHHGHYGESLVCFAVMLVLKVSMLEIIVSSVGSDAKFWGV